MADPSPKRRPKRTTTTPDPPPPPAGDADAPEPGDDADWHRRVLDRSLRSATKKSINRGASFIRAATTLLEQSDGDGFTVQEVADEAGQSLRTLYQYFESKDDLLLAVFEEAMKIYARMIREAIDEIDGPLERLAGAIIAASRMPEQSRVGVDAGLARLRVKLGEVEPALVARSQAPVMAVFKELHREAVSAGGIPEGGEDEAVYMVTALNGAFITSQTLGNEYGLVLPDHAALARFCMQGLGAEVDDRWYQRVSDQVRLPRGPMSPRAARGGGRKAGADVASSG